MIIIVAVVISIIALLYFYTKLQPSNGSAAIAACPNIVPAACPVQVQQAVVQEPLIQSIWFGESGWDTPIVCPDDKHVEIKSMIYGIPDVCNTGDVASTAQQYASGHQLQFPDRINALFGDPCPGANKSTYLTYTCA